MVKELSLWPPPNVTTGIEVPSALPFCSKELMQNLNSCFQPPGQPQMPPAPLLSESGGMPLCLSDAFSPVTPHAFPHTCHYPSMQQLHTAPLESSFPPPVTSAQVATLRGAILRPCQGLMLWPHNTACDFSTLVISALAGMVTLPGGELYQLFHLLHSFRPSQTRHTTQVLWPLLASLASELLGIRGTYNLVWGWKGIEWKADTQTSLSNSECH